MVIPSAAEGFSLVVLEVWFHGKLVVAFDVLALNELIEPGIDGELVKTFDLQQLFLILKGLLVNPEQSHTLGAAGKHKQIKTYGVATMCDRTIDAYDE